MINNENLPISIQPINRLKPSTKGPKGDKGDPGTPYDGTLVDLQLDYMTKQAEWKPNFISKDGTELERFQNSLAWAISSGVGTLESNLVNFTVGTQSIKMGHTSNGGVSAMDKIISAPNMTGKDLTLDIYLHNMPNEYGSLWIYMSSNNFNKSMYQMVNVSAIGLKQGMNRVVFSNLDWTSSGGETFANTMTGLRLRFSSNASKTSSLSFCSLKIGYKGKTKCLIQFDACYDSAYNEGVKYATSKGIKGTAYLYPDMVGSPGKVTAPQLATMYNDGWSFGIYPFNWLNPGVMDTQIAAEQEITRCSNWLDSIGYSRGSKHVAYPSGNYTPSTMLALASAGFKTGRASEGIQRLPLYGNQYLLTRTVVSTLTPLASVKAKVDHAIKTGIPIILVFHTLATPTTVVNDWLIEDYKALIDYIVSKEIECLTIDEFYEGLTKSNYKG